MAKKNDRKPSIPAVTVKSPLVATRPGTKAAAPKKAASKPKAYVPIKAAPVVKSREATPGWFDSSGTKRKKKPKPPTGPTKPPVVTPPVITPPVVTPPVVNPPVNRAVTRFSSALVRSTPQLQLSASHRFDSPGYKGYDAVRGKPAGLKKRAHTDLVQAGHPKRASPVDRVRKDSVTRGPDNKDRDCTKSKERPKDNRPKGGGGSKKFVPWKGTKYGC